MSNIPPGFASKEHVKPPDGRAAAYAFACFDPSAHVGPDGTLIRMWERANIVRAALPAALDYVVPGIKITVVAVHFKVASALIGAYREIHAAGLWHMMSPYGGGFVFRAIKGRSQLSMHSLGLAVDHDPADNPYHVEPANTRFGSSPEGLEVVSIMESHGWFWGARFHAPNQDAMHFQFATGC